MKFITKRIPLRIDESPDGKTLIIYDASTLTLAMGTSSIAANPQMSGITRERGRWLVPKEVIRARVKRMEEHVEDWTNRVQIMKEVLK